LIVLLRPTTFDPDDERFVPFEAINQAFNAYQDLLSNGVKKEDARKVLPLCTGTKFYWTVNLRSLMNFLSNRMDVHAQADIRENANEIYELFEKEYPNIATAWFDENSAIKWFLADRRERNETQNQE
jgi:thymidylate synthase ThyX